MIETQNPTKNKRALILGITGQDGALMAKLLLQKSYKVFGQSREKNIAKQSNLDHLKVKPKINLKYFSLLDKNQLIEAINEIKPDI